jgi:rod shape determining protein RodA
MADYVYSASERARNRARRRAFAQETAFVARLDWFMLAAVAGAVAYGLWLVAGITRDDVVGDPRYHVIRQSIFIVLGVIGLVALIFVDPQVFRRLKNWLYGAMIGMMLVVFLAGTVVRGSKRWIDLGFFRFQPAEFGKVLLVLFLAGFLADRFRRIHETRTILTTVALALPPILLVEQQPDIGSALVYTAALGAVVFVAGARWVHVGALVGIAAFVAVSVLWLLPAAGAPVLKEYQSDRFTAFLDPSHDIQGVGYNINQSITAVGSGGLTGRGVEGATQTKLNYLPEHATDFAFASLSEQRGFLGAALLLFLYLIVVWRGLKVITVARDAFSAIAAGGIVFAFLFQIFVNVGMTIGVAPVTGIPLPFVSIGGSAMVANLLAIGILQAIYVRGRGGRRGGILNV